ncbi:MAG TPA: right-handed parallel beta-helix repeat-containing protein [Armatimonadota bacterium]|nr:right-handed parallel beta-helix repeat-containing protein [Armatimonadota bacterium]
MAHLRTVGMGSLYVSPEGNDAWSGRLPAPNRAGTDGPLVTIAAALQRHPARLLLRGGDYPPLCIAPAAAGCRLGAYPGERPVLAGVAIAADDVRLDGIAVRGDVTVSGRGSLLYACRVGGRLTVSGRDHRVLAGVLAGGALLAGDGLTLSDCLLRGGDAGVWIGGRDCRVRHNAMRGGLFGIALAAGAGAIIEHNVITGAGIGLWLCRAWPGTRVTGNVIRRAGIGMHAAGCAAILFEDNLVEADLAYRQRGGRDNLLRNNSLSGGIACAAPGPIRPAILDGNLLRGCRGWDDRALARRNSRLAAVGAALREDDPALACGFGPLDPALAGPRLASVLPRSADDWPEEPESPTPAVRCRLRAAGQGAFTLTVENCGSVPAAGDVALRVTPAGAGALRGEEALPYALLPGESAEWSGAVAITPGCGRLLLETLPRGEGILPTAVYLVGV